ncbi:hypothetical protein POM88_015717 [Heracleum sosnowskyi]|uniref:Uncharacterized protein n=1 Tax=Heracleum sosnowskyi TaxID=360622 RepID=A0AAD8IM63_9APIA|nr:hypothetical protein POM88_015717 [Heracleum sosnowskyi]
MTTSDKAQVVQTQLALQLKGDKEIPQPNPEYALWNKKDQYIVSILLSSLSDEAFPLIELHELNQKDLPVTTFLQRAKTISDSLPAAGRPISADDLNIYVYKGLRSEFKDIITTLSSRPEAVSFEELHSLLLSHEFIHEKTRNFSTIPEAHMSTKFRPPIESQPQYFGTGICGAP